MSDQAIWLLVALVLYAAFCFYWGVATATQSQDAKSFFLADRRLPAWVFVLAATGVSFSGWIFLGHPDIIYRDGFSFAQVSLCAITVPLAGVLVLKRQWMLSKRYGFVTPGEMLGEYYDSEFLRIFVLVIALIFAVPFTGMQISAAGALLAYISNGALDRCCIGAQMSFVGARTSMNAGGITPMIWYSPSSSESRPPTAGCPLPNRRRAKLLLTITTLPPQTRSSRGAKSRPAAGPTPRVAK